MKKIKIIFIVFWVSLTANSQEELLSDTTIKSVFNHSEIEDLKHIMDYFEAHICVSDNANKNSEVDCYKSFLRRALHLINKGENVTVAALSDQQKLYKEINRKTFDHIWKFEYELGSRSSDTLRVINFNDKGKYAQYLEALGKDSELISKYYESFITAGGMSPSLWGFLLEPKFYDINDIRLRLVIAISYLTMNDYVQRHERY